MLNTYANLTDEALLELTRSDHRMAFTELYDRYWKKLFVIAANKLKDHPVAEELAQDLLADIWQRRHKIEITTTFNGYLSVALKYRIIDHIARQHVRNKYELYLNANRKDFDNVTEDWLSFEELKERLAAFVSELPEKCRIIYKLSKDDGLSNKEIAQRQNISEKTVEAHLTRAMKNLRNKLGDAHFFIFF